jgi:hypothetical protein
MTGFAALGAIIIAGIVALGVYWLATNITLKDTKPKYIYKKDSNEIDLVKDNEDGKT